VVPGNHDVLNSHAVRYDGETEQRVDWITPERFRDIYAEFGFREAIARDPDSLSYAAEPVSGLWVLALDSCRYREHESEPLGSGRIYSATLRWLKGMAVKVAFTGHEHAHDIRFDGSLYDVATGSLIGYACPYRIVEITPEQELGAKAFDAHHGGDETPPSDILDTSGIGWWGGWCLAPALRHTACPLVSVHGRVFILIDSSRRSGCAAWVYA